MAAATQPLPAHLKPVELPPAARDLFAPEEPKAVAAAKAASAPASAALPPPAPPPPMPYKVVGVMLDPEGRRVVVLGKVDKSIIAAPGMQLDEGFVVESIDDAVVQLLYPPRDMRFTLPIPRPPQQ